MRAAIAVCAGLVVWSAVKAATAVESARAPIEITINPEGRVSAALVGALPPPAPCGTQVSIKVLVRNQGFSTSSLQATLVDEVPTGVSLALEAAALTGAPEQMLALILSKTDSGASDVTISFRTANESPDLGGRDRLHFIVRCSKPASSGFDAS